MKLTNILTYIDICANLSAGLLSLETFTKGLNDMFIINLTDGFAPMGEGGARDISRPFPSGAEVNFRLDAEEVPEDVLLTIRMTNSDEVMRLLMATDAVRRLGARRVSVFISYLPYARQDRVCSPGEAFSLEVLAAIINSQDYERVTMFDPHSPVAPALIKRSRSISNVAFAKKVLEGKKGYVILSPDAGAEKKIREIAKAIGYVERPALSSKYRVEGGHIEDVEISMRDFGGRDVYIFDDICEGGATFIKLASVAKERNAGRIFLAVSHGIFSSGFDRLREGGIDHIFTTDSFRVQPESDYLTEVELCTIL